MADSRPVKDLKWDCVWWNNQDSPVTDRDSFPGDSEGNDRPSYDFHLTWLIKAPDFLGSCRGVQSHHGTWWERTQCSPPAEATKMGGTRLKSGYGDGTTSIRVMGLAVCWSSKLWKWCIIMRNFSYFLGVGESSGICGFSHFLKRTSQGGHFICSAPSRKASLRCTVWIWEVAKDLHFWLQLTPNWRWYAGFTPMQNSLLQSSALIGLKHIDILIPFNTI